MCPARVPQLIAVVVVAAPVLLVVLGSACGGAGEEDLQSVVTTAPTVTTSPRPTQTAVVSISPSPAVTPDWVTYTSEDGSYTIRYPSGWSTEPSTSAPQTRIASFDLAGWHGRFRPGDVLIDIGRYPSGSAGYPRPMGATDFVVGGRAGWTRYVESGPDASWKSRTDIGTSVGGYDYVIFAAFGDAVPDKTTFERIVNSLEFSASGGP
jgi:hypothetical protein